MLHPAASQNIIGLFLTIDRDIFLWLLAITFLISVGITALISRGRKWPEIACLGVIIFVALMLVAHVLFKYAIDIPFARLETISLATD